MSQELVVLQPFDDVEEQMTPQRTSSRRPGPMRTAHNVVCLYLREVERLRDGGMVSEGHAENLRRTLDYTREGARYVSYCDLFGEVPLVNLDQADVHMWLVHNPQWKAGDTRLRVIAELLGCFNWAAEVNLLRPSPYRKTRALKRDIVRNQRRDATDAEAEALFEHAQPPLRRLLIFLDRTGARTCEARELLWKNVLFEDGVISLDRHKTRGQLAEPTPRTIGLDPEIMAILRKLYGTGQDPDRHVFLNSRGFPWTKNAVIHAFNSLRRRLRLPADLTAYCLRHRFGTQAILAGMTDRETADLMGHRDPRTTRRYTHTTGKKSYINATATKMARKRFGDVVGPEAEEPVEFKKPDVPPKVIPPDQPDAVMLDILGALGTAGRPLTAHNLAAAAGVSRGALFYRHRLLRLQNLGLIVLDGGGYILAERRSAAAPVREPIVRALGYDRPTEDGPYGVNGFRFAGVDVSFGKATVSSRLVLALWSKAEKRPTPPRPARDVIAEVWGEGSKLSRIAFRQACHGVRVRFVYARCPMTIQRTGKKGMLVGLAAASVEGDGYPEAKGDDDAGPV